MHVSHSENSLKGVIWGVRLLKGRSIGDYHRGLLQGLLRGMLGVFTVAHVSTRLGEILDNPHPHPLPSAS